MKKQGKVYLVGAGPGDPGLLTLNALSAIRKADIILYDHLVNQQILEHAPSECRFQCVGKRCGQPHIPQETTNQMLVDFAKKYRNVVRLKGGDPFIFGRGSEEALALREAKISFEVIPGISSSLSAASYSGIPLTHRGLAASFAVVTGHEICEKEEFVDWNTFKNIDTLVVLMGINRRQTIAEKLILAGRDPQEPLAFIERGTTEEHNVILSSLEEVKLTPPKVKHPGIIIIGKVVQFSEKIRHFFPEEDTPDPLLFPLVDSQLDPQVISQLEAS